MKSFISFALITGLAVSSAHAQRGGLRLGGGGGLGVAGNSIGAGAGAGAHSGLGAGAGLGAGVVTPAGPASGVAGSSARASSRSTAARPLFSDQLASHTELYTRLSPLMASGTDLTEAAAGFKNLGSFVAAVHVSHNLGIPFDQLKAKVLAGASLGGAVHELNANANAKAEVKKARKQSREDMDASHSGASD